MRFTIICFTLCACTAAAAQAPGMLYLPDALSRPTYASAYARMVASERDPPAWMSSAKAVSGATTMPATVEKIGQGSVEFFHACKPHSCGESDMEVMFDGGRAKAAVRDNGRVRLMGKPSAEEAATLVRLLKQGG